MSTFQGESVQATVAEARPGDPLAHAVTSGTDTWKIGVKWSDTPEAADHTYGWVEMPAFTR